MLAFIADNCRERIAAVCHPAIKITLDLPSFTCMHTPACHMIHLELFIILDVSAVHLLHRDAAVVQYMVP